MSELAARGKITLSRVVAGCVVVGLVAGTALVERNSARSSEMLGDISLVGEFQSAADTFHSKYGYLPGDIPAALAAQLRLTPRDGGDGRGNGNGRVEGMDYSSNHVSGTIQTGEPLFFWEDLSAALLIKGKFESAPDTGIETDVNGTNIREYLPAVHIGKGNYFYIYSDDHANYLGMSAVTKIEAPTGTLVSQPGLTVQEAYEISKKMDDPYPLTGKVVAKFVNRGIQSAPFATAASPDTCYDTTSKQFSIRQNEGRGMNCALSFEF